MANSGTGRRSGSGNRRPTGTGNRSANVRRTGAPSVRPAVAPDIAAPVENGASGGPATGLNETVAGQSNGRRAGGPSPVRERSTADERARDRLAEQRAGAHAEAANLARVGRGRVARAAGREAPAGSAKARRQAPKGRKSSTNAAIFGSIFVVLAVVIIVLIATLGGSSPTSKGGQIATLPATPSLVNSVTNVPVSAFAAAGKNSTAVSTQGALVPIPSSAPHPTVGGKPEIVYMGAEYCPYCAAFRWPFAIALSRFGTFTGLKQTASGSHDTYPNTRTLSFDGTKYSSPYISLSTTEFDTNICTSVVSGGCAAYKPLQTPNKADNALFSAYDTAKYFPAAAQASSANGGWIRSCTGGESTSSRVVSTARSSWPGSPTPTSSKR